MIAERYLLEIIDEVVQIIWTKSPPAAETFYQEAHLILHEIEMRAAEDGQMLPGAEAALKSLRQKSLKVGIVTRNCEEAVRRVFPDIENYCDVFVSRDSVRRVKPHPEHLTSVLTALHVSGSEAIMVGDHPIDIQAGKRVGMKTVGVLTGRTKREEFEKAGADYILGDASEVYGLFEKENCMQSM